MEKIWKKSMVIGIIALFISISMVPAFSSETTSIKQSKTTSVKYATIEADGTFAYQTIELTEEEIAQLQNNIATLTDLIQSQPDKTSLLNLLMRYLDNNDYPFLSRLITYLLSQEFFKNKDIIISQGWNYNFNPFKKTSIDFMKTIAVWRYMESSSIMALPSTTAIINFDPMEIKTLTGSQMGLLLRFKGVSIHIPQDFPQESFSFFIGFTRYAGGIELPSLPIP